MPDNREVTNPYASPAVVAATPSSRDRAGASWRWATHCLLGSLLGAVGAAVQREPWNEPIHWANIVANLIVLPAYFAGYAAIGYGFRSVAIAICLVVLSQAIAFNALFYVLYGAIDADFIATPLMLLLLYLALCMGVGLVVRLVRRIADRRKTDGP